MCSKEPCKEPAATSVRTGQAQRARGESYADAGGGSGEIRHHLTGFLAGGPAAEVGGVTVWSHRMEGQRPGGFVVWFFLAAPRAACGILVP